MTEDIKFLRSMAAACRKEARAERRRRPREELILFAEQFDSIANRCQLRESHLNYLKAANADPALNADLRRAENT